MHFLSHTPALATFALPTEHHKQTLATTQSTPAMQKRSVTTHAALDPHHVATHRGERQLESHACRQCEENYVVNAGLCAGVKVDQCLPPLRGFRPTACRLPATLATPSVPSRGLRTPNHGARKCGRAGDGWRVVGNNCVGAGNGWVRAGNGCV